MASWKKIIVSGSNAELNQVTASFQGDGSGITGVSASSVAFADVTSKPTLFSGSAQVISSLSNQDVNFGSGDVLSLIHI